MHNWLEDYLRETERSLSTLPPQARDGELREITHHLEQLWADLRAEGYSEEEATALVIARFGSPRSVGLRLRDVWEGNCGTRDTFLVVLASNWCLQIAYGAAAYRFLLSPPLNNERLWEVLGPFAWLWAFTSASLLPLVWNFVLGRWGGRRVVLAAPIAYLPWFFSTVAFWLVNSRISSPWVGVLTMTLAWCGAWGGSTLMRRGRLRLVSTTSLDQASVEQASALLPKPRTLRDCVAPLACILVGMGLLWAGALMWAKPRVEAVLHPPTPEAAVRVLLSNPSMSFDQMQASTGVAVRALLPRTPQERARSERERRVAYSATMHATEAYRKRRVAFYRGILQAVREGREQKPIARYARASLARLGTEGHQVKGVLRVTKTSKGWEADTSGGPENQPWAWLYDIYYEEPK